MAYISFQHKDTFKGIRRSIMASGSGGDFVHCEIVLDNYGHKVCSSWHPKGVEIRDWQNKIHPELWVGYHLGSTDYLLYKFFQNQIGSKYDLSGLLFNMILNSNIENNKSFCSEICYKAIFSLKQFDLPDLQASSLSPQNLKNILDSHNFNKNTIMALGKKNQPDGFFEIGDLIYGKKDGVYYKTPSFAGEQVTIPTADYVIGTITDNEVNGELVTDKGGWFAVRLTNSQTIVYVPLDSGIYSSKANPEYYYPDTEKKTSGFSWENLLAGISSIANAALGIFATSKNQGTTVGNTEATTEPKQETGILAFVKNNFLLIISAIMALVLIVLLILGLRKKPTPKP